MDVFVNAEGFRDAPRALLERAVRLTFEDPEAFGDAMIDAGEISITLLDDESIRSLNRAYLERDRVTDVIAFSLGDEGGPVLGDVYLGCEQARRQASELGVDGDEELIRLAVHGTLHVLGHDHPEEAERVESPMFALQERIVRRVLAGGDVV
jgi:probable rRNA maturation factor